MPKRTSKRGSSKSTASVSEAATERKRTTVLLPPDVLQALRLRAVVDQTEMSLIMEAALREYLGME